VSGFTPPRTRRGCRAEDEGGYQIRLAILTSHPIQYYAPLFRELAQRIDLEVLYAHRPTPKQQGAAGFGTAFDWDVDLLSGYSYRFLRNVSKDPGTQTFSGCDTPEVGATLRSGKFDALLLTGWHLKSYVQGLLSAKRSDTPVMVRGDSHLDTPRHIAKRFAKALTYPALLRLFDAALYVGVRNRAYYEHYGFPSQRLFHAPHCVDTRWFASRATAEAGHALRSQLGVLPEEQVVLFAGKLVSFKRPLDVVEAVAEVARSRAVSLMVAGAGPLAPAMSARARTLGLRLHALGFCNQSNMPAAYAASQVLALPSSGRETWGLVCNEALACGKPIVVSDAVGSAPDLAADGNVGRTFGLGDTVGLAAAITATLNAPASAAQIRAISEAYSIEAAVAGIEEALSAIAA
jgi:glycosyltransferase involved in cell wall biosynthesis